VAAAPVVALLFVSVLTTYQHHFIDLPTGALLGFFCLWLWPDGAASPVAGARIVDLCAELPSIPRSRAIPMLDLIVPAPEQLARAAAELEQARSAGRVLVCCALGYSRSAAAVAAWLLSTGRAADVDAAIADNDLAAALLDKAGDDPEQGGLAATGRTEQRDQLAPLDLQSHVVDREPRAVTVSDAVKRKRLGSHRSGIGTLEHWNGAISRSFFDTRATIVPTRATRADAREM